MNYFCFFPGKYDLVFGLGGIVSQAEFDNQKTFLRNVLDHFDVSRSKTRVGLILYGKEATIIQSLRASYSKEGVVSLFRNVLHSDPGRNLSKALQEADRVFSAGNGERADADKVLILFVDNLRESDVPPLKSAVLSLVRKSVRIVIVGFKSYVQPSAVEEMLGSGRNPVLVDGEYQLNSRAVISHVIGQLRKGSVFHPIFV